MDFPVEADVFSKPAALFVGVSGGVCKEHDGAGACQLVDGGQQGWGVSHVIDALGGDDVVEGGLESPLLSSVPFEFGAPDQSRDVRVELDVVLKQSHHIESVSQMDLASSVCCCDKTQDPSSFEK